MLVSEWLDIAAVIRDRWPNARLPEDALKQWGSDLSDLPAKHVAAAVDALYREGREFPPNGGIIRSKVIELELDAPTFPALLRTIRAVSAFPAHEFVGRDDAGEPVHVDRRQAKLDEGNVVVAAFVREVGWPALRISDGGDEARLRVKYEGFVNRLIRDRGLAGLEAPGLRAIDRNREASSLGDVAKRVAGELAA